MPDKIVDYSALGEKIRQKRLSTGWSMDAVSEKIGLSESFYGHVERGSRVLSVETLVKIASYLDLSLDYLLLESKPVSDSDKALHMELDSIFRDKSPPQRKYLLNIFRVLADGIDRLHN